jgi:zinc protease
MQQSFSKYMVCLLAATGGLLLLQAQKKDAYEMLVDGVKVIVQPSNNEIVEIQTVIKGGVQNYPAAKAGIESLAISALTECGTQKDDKNVFKNKLDKVSAQVYGYTGMDYASFNMNCIKSDFETVWPLYTDALTIPRFDSKEFDRIKQDAINGLRDRASQPDYAIDQLAKETAFAGKNYAKRPEGTETSVKALTQAETKAYYQSVFTKSRMVIVVVGEIDKTVLEQKIKTLLATIPAGNPFVLKKEMYKPLTNTFKQEKKDVATNYIQAVTGAPLPGTADFNAYNLAMRIFMMRDFVEVRTKNGLSYAPGAWFDGGLSPSTNLVVSTTEPNKYIAVVKHLIDSTKKNGFNEGEVKDIKTTYLTSFYYRQETNGAQASSLVSNEVLHNNWRRALTINEDIKNISPQEVNNAFNKYFGNLTWVYHGDPAKVNPMLYTQSSQTKEKLPASKLKNQNKN